MAPERTRRASSRWVRATSPSSPTSRSRITEEGIFALTITVTDSDLSTPGGVPTTAQTTATVTVHDADLTAGAAVALLPNTGVALPSSTVVGSFTDANPAAPVSDFTAVIDWGDGSPTSLGTITQPGGVGTPFFVSGGHIYAKPGAFTTIINVVDDGGETVTLTGSATVTDQLVDRRYAQLHGG